MYLKRLRSIIFSSLFALLLVNGNGYCQRESWNRNISLTNVSWTIDWDGAELSTMFPYSGSVESIKAGIISTIQSAFNNKFQNPTGITFSYTESGSASFFFDFEAGANIGGRPDYAQKRVFFDTNSKFYTSTTQANDSMFYFARIVTHEIGAVIVASDNHISTSVDSTSFLNICNKGETTDKFNQDDATTIYNLYHCTVTFKNKFGNETINNSTMYIDNQLETIPSAGLQRTWSGNHTCQAVDQKHGDYNRLFNVWLNDNYGDKFRNLSFISRTYEADFKKQFGIKINGGCASSGGQYYRPNDSVKVKEDNSVTIIGEQYAIGGVLREAGYWYKVWCTPKTGQKNRLI